MISFADEGTYLATSWANVETLLELIEIRRKEPNRIIRPHDLWRNVKSYYEIQ